MFEESEWTDGEGAGAPSAAGQGLTRPQVALPVRPAASSHRQRQRLLATLRRLKGLIPPTSSCSAADLGAPRSSDSDDDERPDRTVGQPQQETKKARRRRRRQRQGRVEASAAKRCPETQEEEEKGVAAAVSVSEEPRSLLLSRKQWRNRQKNKRRQKNKFKVGLALGYGEPLGTSTSEEPLPGQTLSTPLTETAEVEAASGGRAASLRLRMEQRLESARFRYINQQLYTCDSQEAARLFQEDPEAFAVYHRGFARQMAHWPESPVQRLVKYLRHRSASLVVADFGCGDCTLARSVRNKVHCFDLVALDPQVTICDMAQVPLEAASVDVAVFCLALMATNLRDILEEASRVLRSGGTLLIAEVASRFSDTRAFVGALARLGFRLVSKDESSSHFVVFELRKAGPPTARKEKPLPGLALQPCLYKRR